ncbi:MAG: glycosyltransferase family 9 protein [Omnitrophica WOR_2 bacterium]
MYRREPFKPGLLERLPETPRKVAILRASRIGDFICATPAFRSIRTALPDAEITLITLPMLREMAQRLPYIDHYASFPGYPGIAEQLFRAQQAAGFFDQMQKEGFDLAVQMQGSGINSNPFMLMVGARFTAGFIREGDPPGLLDAALPLPLAGHEIERVFALPSFIGAPWFDHRIDFPLLPEDHQTADQMLAGLEPPFIGLHPATRQLTRRWPIERFQEAGRQLQKRYGGTVIWIGEVEDRERISQLISPDFPAVNLAGCTSLPVTGAVLTHLSAFITNDTGPAHIAYALSVPTVTIFGAGEPSRNGPFHEGPFRVMVHPVLCRPCSYEECPIGYKCLDEIKTDAVVKAASEIFSSPS